jgi:hypothetical protein
LKRYWRVGRKRSRCGVLSMDSEKGSNEENGST